VRCSVHDTVARATTHDVVIVAGRHGQAVTRWLYLPAMMIRSAQPPLMIIGSADPQR